MRKQVETIVSILEETIADTAPMLAFADPFQLLISVILSAQTTDEQVNRVTPGLFQRFPAPRDLSKAHQRDVEEIIHSTGFFRSKARNIRLTALALVDRFGGEVPETMDELLELPGVGRKSANVVLGTCFHKPAIIVDTHFSRVVRRIGLTEETDPTKIEKSISKLVPEALQHRFSMLLNRHGRRTCAARSPRCRECPISTSCSFGRRLIEDNHHDG